MKPGKFRQLGSETRIEGAILKDIDPMESDIDQQHDHALGGAPIPAYHVPQSPARQPELQVKACERCSQEKRKCVGTNPCDRCVRKRPSCTYKKRRRNRFRKGNVGGKIDQQPCGTKLGTRRIESNFAEPQSQTDTTKTLHYGAQMAHIWEIKETTNLYGVALELQIATDPLLSTNSIHSTTSQQLFSNTIESANNLAPSHYYAQLAKFYSVHGFPGGIGCDPAKVWDLKNHAAVDQPISKRLGFGMDAIESFFLTWIKPYEDFLRQGQTLPLDKYPCRIPSCFHAKHPFSRELDRHHHMNYHQSRAGKDFDNYTRNSIYDHFEQPNVRLIDIAAAHCTTKMSVTKILREMKQKFSTGITECSCCTWYNTGTGRQFEPRVLLSCEIRTILKDIFKNNPRPTPEEMDKLAEDYHTTIEVVRALLKSSREKERKGTCRKRNQLDKHQAQNLAPDSSFYCEENKTMGIAFNTAYTDSYPESSQMESELSRTGYEAATCNPLPRSPHPGELVDPAAQTYTFEPDLPFEIDISEDWITTDLLLDTGISRDVGYIEYLGEGIEG